MDEFPGFGRIDIGPGPAAGLAFVVEVPLRAVSVKGWVVGGEAGVEQVVGFGECDEGMGA